ncbi:MAG: acyl transferase [Bergeyella sp.]|nr:acyl transferase [Bergeyella sp.]
MQDIFSINSEQDFVEACIDTFRFQYENTLVYRRFVDFLGVNPASVQHIHKIPFLPVETYKNHPVYNKNFNPNKYFQSSGTTQHVLSKNWITDIRIYEKSISESFTLFLGNPQDYIFLGLLPNYIENQSSSLVYMVNFLMKKSQKPENGYFLYNHEELFDVLMSTNNRPVLLFGVSFALLDFLDFIAKTNKIFPKLSNLTIVETGGMKGRKREMTKDELLKIFYEGFHTSNIFSEYSMTELFSQAYSLGENTYLSPNWMKVLIRSIEDPLTYLEKEKTGGVNIIDLANLNTCSFIATQDLGRVIHENSGTKKLIHPAFKILGRIDHSDIRGCSLLVS